VVKKRTPKVPTKKILLRKIAKVEAETDHHIMVTEILKLMKPLGMRTTILLVPKGYNHYYRRSSRIRFDPALHVTAGGELFLPREDLEQLTVTHGAEFVEHGRETFYYWDGRRLIDEICTAPLDADKLFFKIKKEKK
jgi:hypothetical protein